MTVYHHRKARRYRSQLIEELRHQMQFQGGAWDLQSSEQLSINTRADSWITIELKSQEETMWLMHATWKDDIRNVSEELYIRPNSYEEGAI